MDIKKKLDKYIRSYLDVSKKRNSVFKQAKSILYEDEAFECSSMQGSSINNYIENNINDDIFLKLLFSYIDDKNLKDSDVYNQ